MFSIYLSYAGITRFRFKGFDLSHCHRDNSTPVTMRIIYFVFLKMSNGKTQNAQEKKSSCASVYQGKSILKVPARSWHWQHG